MNFELIAGKGEIPTLKVLVVDACLGTKVLVRMLDHSDHAGSSDRLPVLITGMGAIRSTDSVMRLLARQKYKMYGRDGWEKAEVDEWLYYVSSQLSLPVHEIVQQASERKKSDYARLKYSQSALSEQVTRLDKHLRTRTFLAGDRLTIADISLAVELKAVEDSVLTERKDTPHLHRWFKHIISLPAFSVYNIKKQFESLKKLKTVPHAIAVDSSQKSPPKRNELTSLSPRKAMSPSNALSEEFDIDTFKHLLTPIKQMAMRYLFDRYDPLTFSILELQLSKHPHNSESFLSYEEATSSLSTLLNTLDYDWKKHSFAVLIVEGSDKHWSIHGVWLWEFPIPSDWNTLMDKTSMTIRSLNPSEPQDYKLIEDCWVGRLPHVQLKELK